MNFTREDLNRCFPTDPKVTMRERMAIVYNVFGKKLETIRAGTDGILLGHTDYALSLPGMELISFGRTTMPSQI